MAHIYSIATTSGLNSNQTSDSFQFNFTVNYDERVYYLGNFMREEVVFDNNRSLLVTGFQNKFSIDIIDTNKLIRDYPKITKDDIRDIIRQILKQALEFIETGKLSTKNIMFNVEIE